MRYLAIADFRDLQDNHFYRAGDVFPHDGRAVAAGRIDELASGKNKANRRLIAPHEAQEAEAPEEANAQEEKPRKRAGRPRITQ